MNHASRRLLRHAACAAFCMIALPAYATEKPATQLLPAPLAEIFHGNEVADVISDQSWFAVVRQGEGYRIKIATALVMPAADPVIDKASAKTGAKITMIPKFSDTAFYIRGLVLKEGAMIDAVRIEGAKKIEERGYELAGGTSVTLRSTLPEITLTATGDTSSNYALVLHSGTTTQTLLSFDYLDDRQPSLLWAGDLNHDGHVDLLIDATYHYNMTHPVLFLSALDEDGSLHYERAAEREMLGC